ncbi:MAG: flavodoxin domain-containing protein [Candidatus Bathyarchaeia archaeon]
MGRKNGRAYVLVEIVPGMEQEFANEVVSKGLIFDSKVEKMDFVHGAYDFVIILIGDSHDIDRRVLEMRKLPYVRSTTTMIPFEMLNWEIISATYAETHALATTPSKGRKTAKQKEKGVKKVLVVYNSLSGNTEKMAIAIAEGIKTVENTQVELTRFIKAEELAKFDAILVGAPTYKDDMPTDMKKLLQEATEKNINLKGKTGASFGSYGWGGEGPKNAFNILKYKFEMKMPEPPLLVKQTPDQKALEVCRDLGKRVAESLFRPANVSEK